MISKIINEICIAHLKNKHLLCKGRGDKISIPSKNFRKKNVHRNDYYKDVFYLSKAAYYQVFRHPLIQSCMHIRKTSENLKISSLQFIAKPTAKLNFQYIVFQFYSCNSVSNVNFELFLQGRRKEMNLQEYELEFLQIWKYIPKIF